MIADRRNGGEDSFEPLEADCVSRAGRSLGRKMIKTCPRCVGNLSDLHVLGRAWRFIAGNLSKL